MPSFFFHIAFDIDKAPSSSPSSCDHPQIQVNKIFPTPFKAITIKYPLNPILVKSQLPTTFQNSSVLVSASGGRDRQGDSGPVGSTKSDRGKIKDDPNSATLKNDWRYGKISVQVIEIADKLDGRRASMNNSMDGVSAGPGGLSTKGGREPSDTEDQDLGWGIVRLYRDNEETLGLYDDVTPGKGPKSGKGSQNPREQKDLPFRDEDCTTLCILAVPSYLTPSDFLGFVGEKTRDEVSHFRMIRTERSNRYMVLMKFRNGRKAREWRKAWNGKAFDGMESENCHVVFVKSIELRTRQQDGHEPSFPDMTNDPFTPSLPKPEASTSVSTALQTAALPSAPRSSRPVAPPTPALIELPTCPVCLERMDESTGLLTIICQHVFHCSCLQKWRGSGCPVCRYTQHDLGRRAHGAVEEPGLNECSICGSDANLWVCLICGNVGCGRYDAAHAFSHYEQSSHCFAMDLATQRVWDYASDGYVHRIVQNKADGKLVQLPSTPTAETFNSSAQDDGFGDYVPREKLDNIGLEYTHLLTSQLESQRMYFEEILERAADKTSQATRAAEKATEAASLGTQELVALQAAQDTLTGATVPALERERDRAARKAEKFEAMARKLEKEWREEKAMSESLLRRVQGLGDEVDGLRREKKELEEQNRDLGFFISGGERLREAVRGEGEGEGGVGVTEEEVRGGTVSVPLVEEGGAEVEGKGKRKGRGKR